MMKEIYIDVKGFENKYQVSNFGNVKNIQRNRILKPWNNGNGYAYISLVKHGKTYKFGLHRIVAQHFLSNSDSLPEVNHIDGDKFNNHIDNLEWCTRKDNALHMKAMLDKKRKVYKIKSPDGKIHDCVNFTKFAKEHGFKSSHISLLINGRAPHAKGWVLIN